MGSSDSKQTRWQKQPKSTFIRHTFTLAKLTSILQKCRMTLPSTDHGRSIRSVLLLTIEIWYPRVRHRRKQEGKTASRVAAPEKMSNRRKHASESSSNLWAKAKPTTGKHGMTNLSRSWSRINPLSLKNQTMRKLMQRKMRRRK